MQWLTCMLNVGVLMMHKIFLIGCQRKILSWTTMIDGHAKLGNYDAAHLILDAMPRKETAAWNALISACEQNGRTKEALSLFHEMLLSKNAKPNEATLVSTLCACANLGAIDFGCWIHVYINKHGINLNCHLTASLIDMYAKCGDLEKSMDVSAERKDVYVWSAVIAALAMYGQGREALDLFSSMLEAKVKPNAVIFTNILCACSHAGLVNEGKNLFEYMEPLYVIVPQIHHYVCMIDILGLQVFSTKLHHLLRPCRYHQPSLWGALLGACSLHGNVEHAELSYHKLLELDPGNDEAFVLLSNIYAKAGKWDQVSSLRKLMRDSGIKKERGCSSIEVNGVVYGFLVGDNSHPFSQKLYPKLDEISEKLRSTGYKSDMSDQLQLLEEDNLMKQSLKLHSEKFAISFGFFSTGSSQLISEVYDRDILLRDRYRFHHFRGGKCSCADFW